MAKEMAASGDEVGGRPAQAGDVPLGESHDVVGRSQRLADRTRGRRGRGHEDENDSFVPSMYILKASAPVLTLDDHEEHAGTAPMK